MAQDTKIGTYQRDFEKLKFYPPLEEKINVISHGIGFIMSAVACVFLLVYASRQGNTLQIFSVGIFGISLMLLYAASTLYHNSKNPVTRIKLKIFDHASIFVLIAGTYTPFTLITLHGSIGWIVFGVSWGLALCGITLKFFFTGKYKILSTSMYILMGWMIVFAIKPLIQNLPSEGLFWLFAGGIFYTVGAIIYSIKMIKFNHAIFHVFVLLGSACHFVAVFFYVLLR